MSGAPPVIAIIGTGRMGRAVRDVAEERGWPVAAAIGRDDGGDALERALAQPGDPGAWPSLAAHGVVEFLALLAGGYTAGRMARFSGLAQGLAVWLWSLLARALASAAAAAWAGTAGLAPHDLAAQSVIGPVPGWGLLALAAVLAVDLVAAVLGGVWGMRYHRKVDAWTISHALTR